MATRTESKVVYATGMAQGIVLVTFPATACLGVGFGLRMPALRRSCSHELISRRDNG
jgi:hypothetical protein